VARQGRDVGQAPGTSGNGLGVSSAAGTANRKHVVAPGWNPGDRDLPLVVCHALRHRFGRHCLPFAAACLHILGDANELVANPAASHRIHPGGGNESIA
jgi:hypothetical protein